ncbi:MAG: hypothetical protein ACYCSG_01820, partial [Thermoplasmataceae archaeon]
AESRINGVSEAIKLGERIMKKSDIQEAILYSLYLLDNNAEQVKWKFDEDVREKGKKMEEKISHLIKCPEEDLNSNFAGMSALVK